MPYAFPTMPVPRQLSATAFHRQPIIPTLLLRPSVSPPSWAQTRSFSSMFPALPAGFRKFSNSSTLNKRLRYDAFRYVHSTPVFRRVPSAESEYVPAASTRTWSEIRQRSSASNWPEGFIKHAGYIAGLVRSARRARIRWKIENARAQHTARKGDGNGEPWTTGMQSKRSAWTSGPIALQANQRGWNDVSALEIEEAAASSDGKVATLGHLTADGEAHMVSIANKKPTCRSATATSLLLFSHAGAYSALLASRLKKGDALAVARIAGIQAAKKTSDLIPLAHPGLAITGVTVRLEPFPGYNVPYPLSETFSATPYPTADIEALNGGVLVTATVACEGKTGVEMEAITAATVAGLTMYDMLKGVDKCMVLTSTRVTAKSGGKSGDWEWDHKSQQRIFSRAGGGQNAQGSEAPSPPALVDTDAPRVEDLEYQNNVARRETVRKAVREKAQKAPVQAEDFEAARERRWGQDS
jgi:molybdenum cofactor biosynthesis enzyme